MILGKRDKELVENLKQELKNQRTVKLLALDLLEGCTTHPSYRAIHKPTATCSRCHDLFNIRRQLNIFGFAIRSGKRGPNKNKRGSNGS